MVVTYGGDLAEETILDGLGYSPFTDADPDDFLCICRHGIGAAPMCQTWDAWLDSPLQKSA